MKVKDYILGFHIFRLYNLIPVQAVPPYPIPYRLVVGIVFNAVYNLVRWVLWRVLASVQLIHLQGLQLEGHQPARRVALFKENTAVNLFALHGHAEQLVKRLLTCNITVSGFGPPAPCQLNVCIEFHLGGPCLELEARTYNISLKGMDNAFRDVAVSLQISGAGPDGVAVMACSGLGALHRCQPVTIFLVIAACIISPAFN